MFVCLDIETTGLDPKKDHIIEIAIVVFDHEKIIKEWSSLVKCPVKIPEFSARLTGINDEMLSDAPLLSEIEEEIKSIIGDMPIMGHFISFDVGFLTEKNIRFLNTQLDTCQLAQVFMQNEASYSLEVLTEKFGISHESAHRAMQDVKANIELFWRISSHISGLSVEEKDLIRHILEKSKWPWAKTVLESLEKKSGIKIPENIEKEKIQNFERHIVLQEVVENFKTPFLIQEQSHTAQDILDYALTLEEKSAIVLPELQDFKDENTEMIKSPNQYLDEERFKIFLQKDSLDISETMLGLKISLWLLNTKGGEKSEIKLIKEEVNLWNDICCVEGEEPSSFYKRAFEKSLEKKITILSHNNFLHDRAKSEANLKLPQNVIIAEVEQLIDEIDYAWHIMFSERRFNVDLEKLKIENQKNVDLVEHLQTKISILFGLVGIAAQNLTDMNEKFAQMFLGEEVLNSKEWKQVIDSAKTIEETLKAFDAKLRPSPAKNSFEKYLKFLCKNLNAKGSVVWVNLDREEQPLIHTFPNNTRKIFSEFVWKNIKNLHLFSHNGNPDFIKNELSLPENLNLKKVNAIKAVPIFSPQTKISNPNSDTNVQEVSHELSMQLTEGNIFILITSQKNAEKFFYDMKTEKKLFVQNLSGGLGKISQMSKKTDGSNIFVGNEDMMNFLIDEGTELTFLAIHKLPFSVPNDPIQNSRSKVYANEFDEYSIPKCTLRLQRIIDKFLGQSWQNKRIMIFDERAEKYRMI